MALLWHNVAQCHAKKVTGNVKLSGVNSEALLTKFAISPYGKGWMGITLQSVEMYETERFLKIHLYQDTNWTAFKRELTCKDKAQHAKQSVGVEFHYTETGGEKMWKAHFGMALDQQNEDRAHYWYVVMDDCSLENSFHDNSIPVLHYELQLWNDVGGNQYSEREGGANAEMQPEKVRELTHLSADETGMASMHSITLVLSMLIAALMAMYIFKLLMETGNVHVAFFLVMLAAVFDALSSICELIHLKAYKVDGVGYYAMDAFSSHFEAMCDSLVALLLLSIASGWTLPSDAVAMPQSVGATRLQSLVQSMRNPAGALVTVSPAGYLALSIIASHALLAQWGRTYNDDFDSYHALEHLPGRMLMLFRMFLGLLMVAACVQTGNNCSPPLQRFYTKLALVGTLWFQSLPLVTWVCSWALPYYWRHPAVAAWGALAQSAALVLLAWLFTSHSSSYHKVSRLQGNESLTDQLASGPSMSNSKSTPKTWNFGKTKIRLD